MSTTRELTCKELVELVTEYLEGTLPHAERLRFEQHLGGCRHCTLYLEQMRQTISAMGHLTEDHIEPDAKEDLLNIFRNWKRS